jgi:hypothetical protein
MSLALLLALATGPLPEPLVEPAPPGAVQREGEGAAILREAKNLRYAQRWFEAAAAYRKFIAGNAASPRVPEARFWLAATLESDQRWTEAADAYTEFLNLQPDQRMLGKEAKLNRIRCWGLVQARQPGAAQGLVAALGDPVEEIQVAAALQLAKAGDPRSAEGLRKGLAYPASADACSLALINMGLKPAAVPASQARFLVIRIKETGKPETVTIRLALSLARAVVNYLSDAQIRQARQKGVDLESVTEQAASLPKGSVLLSVEDGKSTVVATVE